MSSVVPIVTPGQLHAEQLAGKSPALVDVRTTAEVRAGHIPGAQLIPVDELSPVTIDYRLGRSGLGRDETLYITCHAGPRAARAAEHLRQSGLTNIALIEGGTQRWEQAGLPLRRCGSAISLERQVQIAIGSLLILKVVLGYGVHELFCGGGLHRSRSHLRRSQPLVRHGRTDGTPALEPVCELSRTGAGVIA